MKIIIPIRIIDNDKGDIFAFVAGEEIRGWSYHTPDEHRTKMIMAHEFAEGWFQRDRRDAEPRPQDAAPSIAPAAPIVPGDSHD